MNVHDSEKMAGMLEAMGYSPAPDAESADILLFNTCSVRENPERRLFGQVGVLARRKAQNLRLIIGIGGCMMQQPGEVEKVKNELPWVDLVFGTHNLHRLPELIRRVQAGERPVIEVWKDSPEIVENIPVHRQSSLSAFVDIIYGCNKFCTYCIVPFTRGREKSRRPEEILAEVREFAARGGREVTLLGQNVNAYGKDLPGGQWDFGRLLLAVNDVEGLYRVRFTTSHPADVQESMITAMRDGEKICEHLHLPVQSGSDRVLRRMGRRYTADQYRALVERFREAIPDLTLTTDIIVGFPGETEEDFAATLRLVEDVRYDAAYTFIYSPRTGTAATRLRDHVPEPVKKERIYRLIQVVERIAQEKNDALVGSRQEVLVEGPSQHDPAMLAGRTRGNKLVHFPGPAQWAGNLKTVQIREAHAHTLYGDVVSHA